MTKYTLFSAIFLLVLSCQSKKNSNKAEDYKSGTLEVKKITAHIYQHVSYLDTRDFGLVPCNGMVAINNNEAIIFDTPTNIDASNELINWVESESGLHSKVKAIIPTHFHIDCLAGLETFHQKGITSYANNTTIDLAKLQNKSLPKKGFNDSLELLIDDKKIMVEFFGEGHTKDNVVAYFPHDEVLFGGCLIKEIGADKGNLEDANTNDWSRTVTKLIEKHPNLKTIIPGHGKVGGTELLDFTIELFTIK